MRKMWTLVMVLVVLAGWTVAADSKAATNSTADLKRPLVMFIGDSLSAGGKSHPDAGKFPTWSYVEAMKVLTEKTNCVYRFDKRAAGGNSICGQFAGLMGFFKNVTGNGKEPAPDGMRMIIFQDSATGHKPAPDEYETALRKAVEYVEKKPGVNLVLCTTAFEGRKDGDELQESWKKVNIVFRKVAEEKKLAVIPLDISWPRYIEWYKSKKLPLAQEKNWRITGALMDTVHPGHLGAIFMAMNIAREIGIPPEQLDIENPDLGADKAMVKEIRDFIYSWKEPPVLALPDMTPKP
ncbi:MAG: hypothetical protein C0404_05900 [Verrucomicrobia bacterium]|nr:hypothetical protein [Verrucomicrobiota bacterium]